jgi:hypothetical protein
MAGVESLIQGSDKLTSIFGYWPSFHDAEVIEIHFWRGDIDTDNSKYVFPVLTAKLHLWEMTREVNPEGYLVLHHHTLARLRFYDIDDFKMEGFNHQNAILGLSITSHERSEGPSPSFDVHFDPAFGMGATFRCSSIEVLDAVPCTENGSEISL